MILHLLLGLFLVFISTARPYFVIADNVCGKMATTPSEVVASTGILDFYG
jgi:hypothetical protein